MKIDRLIDELLLLANHDRMSATALAKRYEVSTKTIQRDMNALSAMSIPVYAEAGRGGGYALMPGYHLGDAAMGAEEQQMILRALQAMATAYQSDSLRGLLAKYNALADREGGQKVFYDFGVTRENGQVQAWNTLLESAIEEKRLIRATYRSAAGRVSEKVFQPLAIHYKWYAWYCFAYVPEKDAYRTYKVARMDNLADAGAAPDKEHGDVAALMAASEQAYYDTCLHIELHFAQEDEMLMREYFPDCPVEVLPGRQARLCLDVPPGERLWKALILSMGDRITVVSPAEYREELIQTAKNFISKQDRTLS